MAQSAMDFINAVQAKRRSDLAGYMQEMAPFFRAHAQAAKTNEVEAKQKNYEYEYAKSILNNPDVSPEDQTRLFEDIKGRNLQANDIVPAVKNSLDLHLKNSAADRDVSKLGPFYKSEYQKRVDAEISAGRTPDKQAILAELTDQKDMKDLEGKLKLQTEYAVDKSKQIQDNKPPKAPTGETGDKELATATKNAKLLGTEGYNIFKEQLATGQSPYEAYANAKQILKDGGNVVHPVILDDKTKKAGKKAAKQAIKNWKRGKQPAKDPVTEFGGKRL